jgi:histidinol-phosphate phosphatase family protein
VKQAIILSGGKGTRLKEVSGDIPKPMVQLCGKPVLQHQIELLREYEFTDCVLFTGYRSEAVEAYFGDGSRFDVHIRYQVDRAPLGTAGAVLDGWDVLGDRVLVLYGDTMVHVDLDRFWAFHESKRAEASLFLHPNDHPADSDLVELSDDGQVRGFHGYPHDPKQYLPNLVSAALYVVEKRALAPWRAKDGEMPENMDFTKHLFPRMLRQGGRLFGYRSREYIKDIGTPDRLKQVENDITSGSVRASSLGEARPAVFLDRDGTVTAAMDYVRGVDQLELLPGAGSAIHRLNRAGQLAVLVTNQPVVARGDVSFDELKAIHNKLETLLGNEHAFLDAIYFCPHHPDSGFEGERGELKLRCECRKPGTKMLSLAAKELSIDMAGSWMIGDTTTDLQTARNAGVRAVAVRTGYGVADGKYPARPDYEFFDLAEAVDFILHGYHELKGRLKPMAARLAPSMTVAIGGLARSGKSTLASVLRELLAERGLPARILALDSWLLPPEARRMTVRERYDFPGIIETLERLKGASRPVELQLGLYDRMARRLRPATETIVVNPGEIVILEGVVALDNDAVRACTDLKIFLECGEIPRRARFLREYRLRGNTEAEAEALYGERAGDEHPLVIASRRFADDIVRMES